MRTQLGPEVDRELLRRAHEIKGRQPEIGRRHLGLLHRRAADRLFAALVRDRETARTLAERDAATVAIEDHVEAKLTEAYGPDYVLPWLRRESEARRRHRERRWLRAARTGSTPR